ncbi:hypothetical protein TRAPUB_6236 [Trametes pubescens]|uniref:Uncharacterized protein n=1 Tax=Trametes pubescens TaxID=154538 RepID=A0A1M2V6F5_TRAPU|nr:hypothetical protein TRAPUB_6236 [Trametes pubescens]
MPLPTHAAAAGMQLIPLRSAMLQEELIRPVLSRCYARIRRRSRLPASTTLPHSGSPSRVRVVLENLTRAEQQLPQAVYACTGQTFGEIARPVWALATLQATADSVPALLPQPASCGEGLPAGAPA